MGRAYVLELRRIVPLRLDSRKHKKVHQEEGGVTQKFCRALIRVG